MKEQLPNGSYTVASYDQKVLVAGQVPTIHAKAQAQDAAMQIEGVKKVYNYLTVTKNQSAASIAKDAYLTSTAKSRLIAQKDVNANNIKVVSTNGVVYLLGRDAGAPHQIKGAIAGIRNISGVKNVVNLIGR